MKTTISMIHAAIAACALACFALLPIAQAVTPPPDGGYPGFNTAEGSNALKNLTTGVGNAGFGWYSLLSDTTGSYNTALGAGALVLNNADSNTATGVGALLSNATGSRNTANGAFALSSNTEGSSNVAIGSNALINNITGHTNTANGDDALFSNTTGSNNTAAGEEALFSNMTGFDNTAVGDGALFSHTAGDDNTAVGYSALANNSTGDGNVAVGSAAGSGVTTSSNVICIGTAGANVSNSCFIGNIYGQPIDPATATAVGIDATGKLGTTTSSRRFKRDVQPMDKGSQAILALKPVTFHYKSDAKNTPCFGLIAEDVEEVSPALVIHSKDGRPYSVRYDQVNAMLLNEFLKEHKAFIKEQHKVEKLEAEAARQKKQIEILSTGLQNVSAQLELKKPQRTALANN